MLILRIELGNRHVQRSLADGVQRGVVNLVLVDKIKVGVARGEGDDLLGVALKDQWEEEAEEVDLACDVDLDGLLQVGFELLGGGRGSLG